MANENHKNALQAAGLTPEEFADIVRVDPKSVQRWVDGHTKPYPRHRASIARALDLTEQDLWPEQASAQDPGQGSQDGNPVAASDVTGSWAYATDEEAPDPISLIEDSDGAIDLLDNGRGIEPTTVLLAAILEQANTGHNVRLLTCLPKLRLEPLIDHEKIEVRVIDACPDHSLLRVADTMLVTFNLAGGADQAPPLIKLTRAVAGGLFDRLAENLETLWDDTGDPITDRERLDADLSNTDEDDEDFEEDQKGARTGLSGSDERPAPKRSPAATETEQTHRRWPQRAD
jgi:DNA-binding transcriptional regulator YdaS (Cro superfamily)